MPTGTTSGTPQVLLAHHLKQLKLPTVLREYDKVARECAREGVDHPRYLLRLVELELIDRERRTIERRIRAARFPGQLCQPRVRLEGRRGERRFPGAVLLPGVRSRFEADFSVVAGFA